MNGQVSGKTIKYSYRIKAEDRGLVKLVGLNGQVKLKNGTTENVTYTGDFSTNIKTYANSKEGTENSGNNSGNTNNPTTNPPTTNNNQNPSTDTTTELVWTDISKMRIEVGQDKNSSLCYMTITGITPIKEHTYKIYTTKTKTAPDTVNSTEGNFNDGEAKILISDKLELNGDTYLWINESQYDQISKEFKDKFIVSGHKIERPNLPILGARINLNLSEENTFGSIYSPHDLTIGRKLKLKIGKVADNSILKAIKNGETNCLTKLLNYAKSAEPIYNETVVLDEKGFGDSVTNKFNIVNEEYYYVYMELENENGKYYPVEDISLYQGLVDKSSNVKRLINYLDDDFVWNLKDEPSTSTDKKDDTTIKGKLPQTGQSIGIVLAIGTLAIAGTVFFVKSKKYRD